MSPFSPRFVLGHDTCFCGTAYTWFVSYLLRSTLHDLDRQACGLYVSDWLISLRKPEHTCVIYILISEQAGVKVLDWHTDSAHVTHSSGLPYEWFSYLIWEKLH